jgi:hypothetical protein
MRMQTGARGVKPGSDGRLAGPSPARAVVKARSFAPERKEKAQSLLNNARPSLEGSRAFFEALEKLDKTILEMEKQ